MKIVTMVSIKQVSLLVFFGTFLSVNSLGITVTGKPQLNCTLVKGLHANLIRFITKEGFHRDVEDTVEVTVTNSPIPMTHFETGECMFALLAKLSQDAFVDPYEITRIPELAQSARVLNNWTDLESPAWEVKANSTVFVQLQASLTGNLISTSTVRMPVHFRYQKPLSHSRWNNRSLSDKRSAVVGILNPAGYVPITLPLPRLLMRCENWVENPIDEETNCHMIKTLCSSISPNEHTCFWVMVPYKSNSKGSTVFIPVGDSDQRVMITLITLAVVLGGTCFVLVTLFRAKTQMDILIPSKIHQD